MNEFTPAQVKAIQTWTDQRDALLREIGIFSTQAGDIRKELSAAGLALADLHNQIAEARGQLSELDALEQRWKGSLSTDIAELQVRKSRLEGEIAAKSVELKLSEERNQTLIAFNAELSAAHLIMTDQAKIVDSVVGQIIQTSQLHASDMQVTMTKIEAVSNAVIERGNENVKKTNIILEKLPRYIFELQKPIPIRRTYHAPRGTVIEPERKEPNE